MSRGSRRAGAWLAAGVLLACFATAGGSMTTTDAVIAYDVTRSIVEHGSIALSEDVPRYEAYRGTDGRFHSPFGIAQSLWNVPFYLAGRMAARLIGRTPAAVDTIQKATVALGTVPAVALLSWCCFQILVGLGVSPVKAVRTVLITIFATPLWPYSGFGFNQPLAALFLWGAVAAAIRVDTSPWRLAAAGLAAGLAALTRYELAVAALILAGYVGFRSSRGAAASLAWYAAGLIPMFSAGAALNWWRFGHPLVSGHLRDETPGFGGSLVAGMAGLLLSPYASLLLYCPVVLLSVAGLRQLWRRDRGTAVLFGALLVVYFLFYASLGNWTGGRSYGPRYLVPLLPALILPIAFWSPATRWRPIARAVVVVSVIVQLPGVLVDYSRVDSSAGSAHARPWSSAPLLANVRAAAGALPRELAYLAGRESRPRVQLGEAQMSRALGSGLDVWWLALTRLGLVPRLAALGIGMALLLAAVMAMRRSLLTASRATRIAPPA